MGIPTNHVIQIRHAHHAYLQEMGKAIDPRIHAHHAQNQTVTLLMSAKKIATNPRVNTKLFSNQILIFYKILSDTRLKVIK